MSYIWDIPDLATTEGLIQYWTKDPSMNNQKGHQISRCQSTGLFVNEREQYPVCDNDLQNIVDFLNFYFCQARVWSLSDYQYHLWTHKCLNQIYGMSGCLFINSTQQKVKVKSPASCKNNLECMSGLYLPLSGNWEFSDSVMWQNPSLHFYQSPSLTTILCFYTFTFPSH